MIETVISSRVGPNLAELQFLQSRDPFRLSTLNARSSSYVHNTGSQHVQEGERERERWRKQGRLICLKTFVIRPRVAIGRDVFNKIYARSCR